MTTRVIDSSWVRSSFMLPRFAAGEKDAREKSHTEASLKFTDTTLGGNFAINSPPQYTRVADLKVKHPLAQNSKGMGRIYSSKIDTNMQIVHFRMGVPTFASFFGYWGNFYDYESATLSKTGRSPGFLYYVSKVAGFVVTYKLQALMFIGRLVKFITNTPSGKFYYLKPTMPMYWTAANVILNSILINDGTIPKVFSSPSNAAKPNAQNELRKEGDKAKSKAELDADERYFTSEIITDETVWTRSQFEYFHRLMPDIFNSRGAIDLYKIANKAQRMADNARMHIDAALEGAAGDPAKLREYAIDLQTGRRSDGSPGKFANAFKDPGQAAYFTEFEKDGVESGLEAYVAAWNATPFGMSSPPQEDENGELKGTSEAIGDKRGWDESLFKFFIAEMRDGSQFCSFRVNETGSSTLSVSSSTTELDIKSKVNGMSGSNRSKHFDFSGGNIGDGLIAGTVESVLGGVKDVVMGLGESVGFSGMAAILGSAFAEFPERWQDSSATANSMSYTIELRSPYGNPISRLISLWTPLSMLLAMALPKAAGKAAYDSPFLVEVYDQGKAQTRLGIIDSMTVEHGVGNIGWTKDRKPLGINVTFTVKCLNTSLYMPINASPGLFDQQSMYTDYMAILGGLGVTDQIYATNRIKLNLTNMLQKWESYTSPAKWVGMASGTSLGQFMSGLSRYTDRY